MAALRLLCAARLAEACITLSVAMFCATKEGGRLSDKPVARADKPSRASAACSKSSLEMDEAMGRAEACFRRPRRVTLKKRIEIAERAAAEAKRRLARGGSRLGRRVALAFAFSQRGSRDKEALTKRAVYCN